MNILHRTVVIFSMAISLVSLVSASEPEGKKVVQNSAAVKTPLEQAEKDLAAAEKELEEYEKAVRYYFRRCGNEVMEVAEELASARRRLVELEKNKGTPGEIKAVKEKVSHCERYFHELEQEQKNNPLSKDDITQVMNRLRGKVADLLAARDKLKAEAGAAPVKKAP